MSVRPCGRSKGLTIGNVADEHNASSLVVRRHSARCCSDKGCRYWRPLLRSKSVGASAVVFFELRSLPYLNLGTSPTSVCIDHSLDAHPSAIQVQVYGKRFLDFCSKCVLDESSRFGHVIDCHYQRFTKLIMPSSIFGRSELASKVIWWSTIITAVSGCSPVYSAHLGRGLASLITSARNTPHPAPP